jgi:hypothetical protein
MYPPCTKSVTRCGQMTCLVSQFSSQVSLVADCVVTALPVFVSWLVYSLAVVVEDRPPAEKASLVPCFSLPDVRTYIDVTSCPREYCESSLKQNIAIIGHQHSSFEKRLRCIIVWLYGRARSCFGFRP